MGIAREQGQCLLDEQISQTKKELHFREALYTLLLLLGFPQQVRDKLLAQTDPNKKELHFCNSFVYVAPPLGLEPRTL